MKRFLLSFVLLIPCMAQPSVAQTLKWSGYEWVIKSSDEPIGPGPALWSDAPESVWVDDQDRLHLKLRNVNGRWYAAEVYSLQSLGHGQYIFYLDSRVDNLDPNVVVGLFVHSDDQNEIDIEFSKWGEQRPYTYHQFVLQPRIDDTNLQRSDYKVPNPPSTHGFIWSPDQVRFRSFIDHDIAGKLPIKQWDYSGPNNPKPTGDRAHINLWLYQGLPPTDGQEVVLVVSKFEFVPLNQLGPTPILATTP